MIGITLLMTGWATVAGMTAHTDSCNFEMLFSGTKAAAEPKQSDSSNDPFSAALAVMNGESNAREQAGWECLPPSGDCLHPAAQNSVSSADLADGKVSSFRFGPEGLEKVTVNEDGGLWVGVTAVDGHVIEIAGNGKLAAGTYTLIDYEGSIGGAGFKGLTLRGAPNLHAMLVNNTAETKIELVVSDAAELEWPVAAIGFGNLGEAVSEITGILGLLGLKPVDPTNDALQ